MLDFKSFRKKLYHINNDNFEDLVFEAFNFQVKYNEVYKNYVKNLKITIADVKSVQQIPFLPINFFKTHPIKSGSWTSEIIFESSGTTGSSTSRHYIDDLDFYLDHSLTNFNYFYGNPADYHILALLPSYLERKTSSLIFMVKRLMEVSNSPHQGYYLYNFEDLIEKIEVIKRDKDSRRKIMLVGITFALLDLVEQYRPILPTDSIVMETGGMKGRRKEIVREEFYKILQKDFIDAPVHAEYGMTELLSQAYSTGGGEFITPPWMKILTREINDPFEYTDGFGGINVVDLANIHSCAFIETNDLGKIKPGGKFEVLGRMDNSDIRGCNLLLS